MDTYTAVIVVGEGVSQDELVDALEGLPEVATLAFLGPGALVESGHDAVTANRDVEREEWRDG